MTRDDFDIMCDLLEKRDWWESVLEDAESSGNFERAVMAAERLAEINHRLGSQ